MSDIDTLNASIITIATETFRLDNTIERMLDKLDYDDRKKYSGQYSWFVKKVTKAIQDSGYEVVDLKGHLYDAGTAVIPLNIEEFEPDDELIIDYLLEPIILKDGKVVKEGTAILKRR